MKIICRRNKNQGFGTHSSKLHSCKSNCACIMWSLFLKKAICDNWLALDIQTSFASRNKHYLLQVLCELVLCDLCQIYLSVSHSCTWDFPGTLLNTHFSMHPITAPALLWSTKQYRIFFSISVELAHHPSSRLVHKKCLSCFFVQGPFHSAIIWLICSFFSPPSSRQVVIIHSTLWELCLFLAVPWAVPCLWEC